MGILDTFSLLAPFSNSSSASNLRSGAQSGTAIAEPLDALEDVEVEVGEGGRLLRCESSLQEANCECQGVSKNSDVKKYCHSGFKNAGAKIELALRIYPGSRHMCITNDDLDQGRRNGTLCKCLSMASGLK